ncbi:hypothetical protein AA313_de0209384 [Arthrobotrys entomopaga]|nr:hypothetical protein AA313_de0209384 [Arthrobotrys entomopaga]
MTIVSDSRLIEERACSAPVFFVHVWKTEIISLSLSFLLSKLAVRDGLKVWQHEAEKKERRTETPGLKSCNWCDTVLFSHGWICAGELQPDISQQELICAPLKSGRFRNRLAR